MRIITCNVNGIRAAARKGFFKWLESEAVDVICLQEVRADASVLKATSYDLPGYHCYYHPGEIKGYSGVALFSRQEPDRVTKSLDWPIASQEGRYIQADFGDLCVASLYMPSGSSGEHRQAIKFKYMEYYQQVLAHIREQKQSFIICGDWNIVHTSIDIKNFKANQNSSGCLPEERAWLDSLFSELGFVDAFRVVNQQVDEYTWWSYRGRAWDNNVGWRIDYQIITPDLQKAVTSATIYKDQRFSDHAPFIIDYAISL